MFGKAMDKGLVSRFFDSRCICLIDFSQQYVVNDTFVSVNTYNREFTLVSSFNKYLLWFLN